MEKGTNRDNWGRFQAVWTSRSSQKRFRNVKRRVWSLFTRRRFGLHTFLVFRAGWMKGGDRRVQQGSGRLFNFGAKTEVVVLKSSKPITVLWSQFPGNQLHLDQSGLSVIPFQGEGFGKSKLLKSFEVGRSTERWPETSKLGTAGHIGGFQKVALYQGYQVRKF